MSQKYVVSITYINWVRIIKL